jgi:uncharacterized membrane protein
MHWSDSGWGMGYSWGTGLGWLFIAIFCFLIILGIIYRIKLVTYGGKQRSREESPLDILGRRYARRLDCRILC